MNYFGDVYYEQSKAMNLYSQKPQSTHCEPFVSFI